MALLIGAASPAPAVDLPPVAIPGEGALDFAELIYALDEKPTPQCHASTLAETKGGIVAAWFGGTRERHVDVGIWFAQRRDGSWSEAVQLVDGSEGEEKEYSCWNPVLYQVPDGPLMLFYKVGPSPSQWWGMLIVSEDQGKTWSEPRRLGKDEKIGHLLGPVKNKPEMMADGKTLVCPSSSEHDRWRVHFEVTRDLGKTWQVIGPIHDGKEFGAIQPSILFGRDGRLQILCRSRQNAITTAFSKAGDGGWETWGEMTALPVPNPGSGIDALTMADGRHVLVYNHTTKKTGARSMLNLAISEDGSEWTPILTLEREKGEFSYPAVIQSADGKLHISYTYQRRSVKYAIVDPSKL